MKNINLRLFVYIFEKQFHNVIKVYRLGNCYTHSANI